MNDKLYRERWWYSGIRKLKPGSTETLFVMNLLVEQLGVNVVMSTISEVCKVHAALPNDDGANPHWRKRWLTFAKALALMGMQASDPLFPHE